MDFLDRIAERVEMPKPEEGVASKWAEIKNGEGKITGFIEMFWGGEKLGWVTIPGASRVIDAGSEQVL